MVITVDMDEWEQVRAAVRAARDDRERQLGVLRPFADAMESLLFELDPIGLNFGSNTDEYRAEAQAITLRLPDADSAEAALVMVHEEFVRWFGEAIAGPRDHYLDVAGIVWERWCG